MTETRGTSMAGDADLSMWEAAALAHPAVAACAAMMREVESGGERVVLYFVPSRPVESAELGRKLRAAAARPAMPLSLVAVSSLPLTEAGETDYRALSRLGVLEEELVPAWERSLQAGCRGPIAVVIDESPPWRLPLHLDDLLPLPIGLRSQEEAALGDSEEDVAAAPRSSAFAASRSAIVDGGVVIPPPGAPRDLVEVFRGAAREGEKGIHYRGVDRSLDSFQSYRELAESAERILLGLRAARLEAGARVLLLLGGRRDFLEGFWAAILGGFIPVPMALPSSFREPDAARALENVWRLLDRPAILANGELVDEVSRVLRGFQLEAPPPLSLEQLKRAPGPAGAWHSPAPDDVALMMLTSGSTGAPKAVQLTHANLISRAIASIHTNGFLAGDVALNWMPLDHVAGLIYFHLRDTQLGCRQIQLDTAAVLQDPLAWLDAMGEFRVTVTFAPNFAYGLVNDCERELGERRWDLSSVRFILNGAEAIVARTARRFLRLLEPHGLSPNVMHPAWGMSETSSGVTYSDRFSLASTSDEDAFVEVGRPIPRLSLRIVDEDERVVEEGTLGALQVKGAVVTPGYFNDEAATRDAFTRDGWFRTGDLGILRDGRLTITGREKDVVNIRSVKYYSHAIESAVEELEGVVPSFTAACAVRGRNQDTDRLAIFFCPRSFDPERLSALLQRIRAAVASRIGVGIDYLVPVAPEIIPKTSLGKIQRSLLSERLRRGELDEAVKRADLLAANAHTIPDWFFRKIWVKRKGARPAAFEVSGQGLVFVDGAGVGRRFRETASSQALVVEVEAASVFEKCHRTSYRIDPQSPEDYHRLLRCLRDEGIDPDWIVHLWTYGPEGGGDLDPDSFVSAQSLGSLSLLSLAQALAAPGMEDKRRTLIVASSHLARVRDSDRVSFEKCPLLGLVKSIPQEMPNFHCLHIDLEEREDAGERISSEVLAASGEREIAYRDGERFVARLAPMSFSGNLEKSSPLEAGGLYLVTGGLGGIGSEIAAFLLAEVGARVLLVGRTPRPLDGEREERLTKLARLSGTVAYEPCDVTDHERLNAVVREYETRWGARLAGALHLAGSYAERLVVEESREGFLSLSAPRVLGALHLERILEERGGGLLLTSSSVAGFFGGASIASYSAASSSLDGFHERLTVNGRIRSYCFQWSNWDGVGQARESRAKELPRSLGYLPIPAERAIVSLRIGLAQPPGAMLVGLERDNPHLRRFLQAAPENLENVRVYAGADDAERLGSAGVELRDRFGTRVPCEIVSLDALPLGSDGNVDRERLRGVRRPGHDKTMPATETERALADIWRTILGTPEVGVEDSFFELGGDSLLAVRALSKIRDRFRIGLSLKTAFESPRLGDLARAIDLERDAGAAQAEGPGTTKWTAADPESLLEHLDELDDADVDRLLAQMAEEDEN